MKLDLDEFLISGRLLGLSTGSTKESILAIFGRPDVDTPQHKSYPAMLVYGDIEFRLRAGKVTAIAVSLAEGSCSIRHATGVSDFSKDHVLSLLAERDVEWKVDHVMSNDDVEVIVTTQGVHLLFDAGRLTRAVASKNQ